MKIVVCVKQVPDTWAERKLKSGDATLDRESVDGLINELDEYAIEEALQIKEAHGGEVTVLTMGPEKASESVRKALSMGADKAVHLVDDALAGSDVLQTSYALAKVLEGVGFDLVVCGAESTDARMGAMAAMLAEGSGCRSCRWRRRWRSTAPRSGSAGSPRTGTGGLRRACLR